MGRVFTMLWRNKWITANAQTIDDMIEGLEAGAAQLRLMRDAGVTLNGGAEDDYANLTTTDPEVAKRFDFEEELLDDEDEEDYYGSSNGHGLS